MGVDSNTTVVFQGIDNNYMRGRWVAQTVSTVIFSLLDAASENLVSTCLYMYISIQLPTLSGTWAARLMS